LSASACSTYPWLAPHWRRLFADEARLHHALLIAGQQGLGKLALAEQAAAALLCEAQGSVPADGPCGVCDSCRWHASGNHPDFRRVMPEQDEEGGGDAAAAKAPARKRGAPSIKIDQIRGLEGFVYVGSHRRGNRVILIAPAEAMNAAATNALLKILEEPPAGVHFILVSMQWRRLLPTVRSRCRRVMIGRPDPAVARAWLAAAGVADAERLLQVTGGAPLAALAWSEAGRMTGYEAQLDALAKPRDGMLAMAARWDAQLRADAEGSLETLVETVEKWLVDLVHVKLYGAPRFHLAWRQSLERLAGPAAVGRLFACYNELIGMRAIANHPVNSQLFLEDLAARYLRALKAESA